MIEYHKLAEQYRHSLRKERYSRSILVADRRWRYLKKSEKLTVLFLSMVNSVDLCLLVQLAPEVLTRLINSPTYTEVFIPKKRGGKRKLEVPEYLLLGAQKRLNSYLQSTYIQIRPEYVHGFVLTNGTHENKANIVSNATPHVGKKYVMNLDLEDFFPSIKAKSIRELFLSELFNFDHHLSTCLALLTTIDGHLPQGAPTSPVLSNFVCLEMDKALHLYAFLKQVEYTRYADDLTFSADLPFDEDWVSGLKKMIEQHGFRLNNEKFRIQSTNRKQSVTGVTVNKRLNVDRKFYKKVRAMLHDLKQNGIESATIKHFGLANKPNQEQCRFFIKRLEGYLSFIGQVRGADDPIYNRMKSSFNAEFNVE
jgi:RNA-directed DNA polymerase